MKDYWIIWRSMNSGMTELIIKYATTGESDEQTTLGSVACPS